MFWKRTWRPRSPEAFVEDCRLLARRYKVDTLLIPDEYPTSDRGRWEKILEGLLRADLGLRLLMETRAEDIVRDADLLADYRQAGILHIYVGLEATDQARLDAFGKASNEISRAAIRRMAEAGIVSRPPSSGPPQDVETVEASSASGQAGRLPLSAIARGPYAGLARSVSYSKSRLSDTTFDARCASGR